MIAVWGANSFIGRHVTHRLCATNQPVKLFARNFDEFPFDLPDTTQKFIRDFNAPDTYINDLADCQALVLLVSASQARTFANDPAQEVEQNVKPYQHLFEALQSRQTAIEHIIYASSGGTVYGITAPYPIPETHPTNPISPYGQGKLAIENLLIDHAAKTKCTYTILRIANPVGRFGKRKGLIDYVLAAANSGKPLTVNGDGKIVRDYFDVAELAEAFDLCLHHPAARNEIFNVGSGIGHSINDVITIAEKVTNKKITVRHNPPIAADAPYNVLDCTRTHKEIAWKHKNDLMYVVRTLWG